MSPANEDFDMMGSCLSHPPNPSAKLVVLQEDAAAAAAVLIRDFPEPVKVAEILRERPGFFVCHADAMRYDEYVSPLSVDHELQMEQLYFMLPVTKLRHPLSASEMAALAVKVSAAMDRSRRRRRCCRQTHRFIFSSSSAGVGDEYMHEWSHWKNEEPVLKLQRMNGPGPAKSHDVPLCCDAAMRTPKRSSEPLTRRRPQNNFTI